MFPNSSSPSGGNRIDVTTLAPFNNENAAQGNTSSAFITLLSITGKGFLDSFIASGNGTSSIVQVRVTVDGVVKVFLAGSNINHVVGVMSKDDLYTVGSTTTLGNRIPGGVSVSSTVIPSAAKPYPTTDGTSGVIFLGDAKIFFTKSLLLEIATNNSSSYYRYAGAFR